MGCHVLSNFSKFLFSNFWIHWAARWTCHWHRLWLRLCNRQLHSLPDRRVQEELSWQRPNDRTVKTLGKNSTNKKDFWILQCNWPRFTSTSQAFKTVTVKCSHHVIWMDMMSWWCSQMSFTTWAGRNLKQLKNRPPYFSLCSKATHPQKPFAIRENGKWASAARLSSLKVLRLAARLEGFVGISSALLGHPSHTQPVKSFIFIYGICTIRIESSHDKTLSSDDRGWGEGRHLQRWCMVTPKLDELRRAMARTG